MTVHPLGAIYGRRMDQNMFFYRRKTQRHVNYQGAKKGWTALHWSIVICERMVLVNTLQKYFNCGIRISIVTEKHPTTNMAIHALSGSAECEPSSCYLPELLGDLGSFPQPQFLSTGGPEKIQPLLPSKKYGNPWKSQQSFHESLKAISRI